MNIGFDATLLRNHHFTGVEKYIINLLRSFNNQEFPGSLTIFVQKAIPDYLLDQFGNTDVVVIPSTNRVLIDQVLLPIYAKKKQVDLMHFPVFGASPFYRGKHVLTIHDATLWKFSDTISLGAKVYYKPLFRQSINRASRIITVSRSSLQDICDVFPKAKGKITSIYEALDQTFAGLVGEDEIPSVLQKPYILSVGTLEPRKNLFALIKAFEILKEKYAIPHKLVLIGRTGWLKELNIKKELMKDIVFTGYVSDRDMYAIYKNATLYAFPSLYEGFGFPLLEAMACHIPIVCSNSSSLPEIGGDSCLYVPPRDVSAWVEGIKSVIDNKVIRNDLISRGDKRVPLFNWEATALATIKEYVHAMSVR